MNICVYGASSNLIDPKFIADGETLGAKMAQRGIGLVFGGGASGMMGAAARGIKANNGYIIGIAPSFFNVDGVLFDKCDEYYFPNTMRERKAMMEEKSDGFIITVGGVGTFDEFFDIITLKQLRRIDKPIVILNTDGYYDPMLAMLQNAVDKNFMKQHTIELVFVTDDVDAALDYIQNYKPSTDDITQFRNL